VADYNKHCRTDVMKFTKEWTDLTHKMGYWVDLENPYITYDNRYIETLWWLLQQLYKKGLLYKGYTIQPYSPAAGTGLSSHELNQPGCYRDVKDLTVVGQFKMKNPKPEMAEWGTPYFIAWTTTPWTLPSNTALCVGPKIDYVAVQTYNAYNGEKMTVVLAKPLLYTHFNKKAEDIALEDYKPGDKLIPFKVVGEYKGTDLVGMEYEQLLPWVKPVEVTEDGGWREAAAKAFRVIPGDYVTTEDGTGIVHIAPTFGADDARSDHALFGVRAPGADDVGGEQDAVDQDDACGNGRGQAVADDQAKADGKAGGCQSLAVHALFQILRQDRAQAVVEHGDALVCQDRCQRTNCRDDNVAQNGFHM
jgi:isoleucyl-tRNA synthetase